MPVPKPISSTKKAPAKTAAPAKKTAQSTKAAGDAPVTKAAPSTKSAPSKNKAEGTDCPLFSYGFVEPQKGKAPAKKCTANTTGLKPTSSTKKAPAKKTSLPTKAAPAIKADPSTKKAAPSKKKTKTMDCPLWSYGFVEPRRNNIDTGKKSSAESKKKITKNDCTSSRLYFDSDSFSDSCSDYSDMQDGMCYFDLPKNPGMKRTIKKNICIGGTYYLEPEPDCSKSVGINRCMDAIKKKGAVNKATKKIKCTRGRCYLYN